MGSMDTLHLRWDKYEPSIKYGFSQLRQDEDFYDVTLACGENQIKAHKVILGACSSFFKSLLKSVPHQHPLLYLSGIDFDHLESVLAFMYHGEVRIRSEDFDHFLAVAQELKVNGLIHNDDDSSSSERTDEPYAETLKRESSTASSLMHGPNKKKSLNPLLDVDSEIEAVSPLESTSFIQFDSQFEYVNDISTFEEEMDDEGSSINESILSQDKMNQLNELIDARSAELVSPRDANKNYRCLKCPYSSINRHDVTRHVESKHLETDGFSCDKCGGTYKTRRSLYKHKRSVHRKDFEIYSSKLI